LEASGFVCGAALAQVAVRSLGTQSGAQNTLLEMLTQDVNGAFSTILVLCSADPDISTAPLFKQAYLTTGTN
jgi:hypothetical protein